MGPQFLAGAIWGSLIIIAYWVAGQCLAQSDRSQTIAAHIAGLCIGILAGYGMNHLVFVGFLGYPQIPFGGPGSLSLLLFVLIFLSITQVVRWRSARKSRYDKAVANVAGLIAAVLAGLATNYLVFVWLLGFPTIPTGGFVFILGAISGIFVTSVLLRLTMHIGTP